MAHRSREPSLLSGDRKPCPHHANKHGTRRDHGLKAVFCQDVQTQGDPGYPGEFLPTAGSQSYGGDSSSQSLSPRAMVGTAHEL